jgi:hypothetical protein
LTVSPALNGTIDKNRAYNCSYQIGIKNQTYSGFEPVTGMVNQTLVNTSTTQTKYINASGFALASTLTDTGYNNWNNISFFCNYTGRYDEGSNPYFFRVDITSPLISFGEVGKEVPYNITVVNTGVWTFLLNYTENNYDVCGLRYYQDQLKTYPYTLYLLP